MEKSIGRDLRPTPLFLFNDSSLISKFTRSNDGVSAVRAIGPGYGDVCISVLLHDNDNEDTKWLLIGLDRLVKHYEIA